MYAGQGYTKTGTTYAWSVYAKAGELPYVCLWEGNISANFVTFDLVRGSIVYQSGATGSMTYVGNGWYRCTMINTQAAGYNYFLISPVGGGGTSIFSPNYTGDGWSGIYVWGAQLGLVLI